MDNGSNYEKELSTESTEKEENFDEKYISGDEESASNSELKEENKSEWSSSEDEEDDNEEFLVAATKRKLDTVIKESDLPKEKKIQKSLKDNPRLMNTPALRKKREQELEGKSINKQVRKQIHPSIMAQPSINKEKERERELRNKERDLFNTLNSKTKHQSSSQEVMKVNSKESNQQNNDLFLKIMNNDKNITPNKTLKQPKKIKMQAGADGYNVIEDLNTTKCNITFGELMDVSPKIRSQVSQGLKFDKNTKIAGAVDNLIATTVVVNNIEHTYQSKSKEPDENDIAMVDVLVDGVKGKALIDSCSNLNIVTRKFLNKLPTKYQPVGISHGRIRLATMNDDYSENHIIKLSMKINKLKMNLKCRIIDKEDPFYDILINLKTQVDYRLFIHPIRYSLCQFSPTGIIKEIAPINNDYNNEDQEKYLCMIRAVPSSEIKNDLKEIEGMLPRNYIHNEKFKETLDEKYRDIVINLLEEHIDIVATSAEELTPSDLPPHKIRLKANSKPIKQRFYRLSKLKSDILKEELTKLINKKLIEPSYSEWSSPVVLVPKHNGKWRMCVDYRKVNEATEKDSYSLPNISEIFDSLDGARIFTTMDLYSGYHQILMDQESVEVTSFTTKFGNYQFKVMPFGLTGAPATFQREMNRILFPFIGVFVFNFIDDILIYSKTVEEHIEHIRQVLQVFHQHKLKINIEKCSFMKTEVEVLGHTVSTKGLSPIDSKVQAIKEMRSPANLHELRSFLGAVGYYRTFIDQFAQITAPIVKLTRKNVKYHWSKEQEESFIKLKEKLINAPILKFPCFDKPFIIRTDASYDGIGGVLLQRDENDNKEHPVHYISRTLNKHECNYGITDLEGTALIYCVTKFKPYILGNPIQTIVYTDHKPLIGIFKRNKEPTNARQTRWITEVSSLGIEIKYEPGKRNVIADALSRVRREEDKTVLATKITTGLDENLLSKVIKEFIEEKFTNIDGTEYFIDGNTYRKLVTDTNERIKLILEAHNIGHEGYHKTYQRLRKSYYWNNMVNDIKRVIFKCDKCQLNKPQPYPLPVEDIPTPVEGPFTHLGLDIIGPLKKTLNNNQYIFVLVDYFTKWVEAEPTENITSKDVIKFLINVFARHGVPQVITTDNGVQFSSDMTKIFLDLYDVYIKFTSTYHPESNGLTENRNKEIGKLLRLLSDEHKEWDEVLPSALWALRTAKNSVTNHSSFELVYGREDQQPFDIAARPTKEIGKSSDEVLLEKFVNHYLWTMEAANNVKNANKYWATRREEKNSMSQAKAIRPGDLVLVRNFNRSKLEPYFVGPLKVIKKQFNTVTLADPKTGIQVNRNVHLKNIVKYNSASM